MKRLIVLAFLLALAFPLTAVAQGVAAPTDFTLTDLGAITVRLNWTNNADNAMIRVSREAYPADVTEGELVYYGDAATFDATGYALDTTTYYFSAWGYAADDTTHSTEYVTGTIGGEAMEVIGTEFSNLNSNMALWLGIAITAGLVALAYWRKDSALYLIAALAVVIVGWQMETRVVILMVLFALYTGYRGLKPYLPW